MSVSGHHAKTTNWQLITKHNIPGIPIAVTPYKRQNMDREIPAEVKTKMLKTTAAVAVTGTAATAPAHSVPEYWETTCMRTNFLIRKVDRGPIEISVSASAKLMPLQEEIVITGSIPGFWKDTKTGGFGRQRPSPQTGTRLR